MSANDVTGVVHIAGHDVRVNHLIRQRCAWCGAMLADYDLERIAVPEGQDWKPPIWPVGGLVEVDGNMTSVIEHDDGEQLPKSACARIDAAVTR
jgi:hypothetical protein